MAATLANILAGAAEVYHKILTSAAPVSPMTGNVVSWTSWTQWKALTEDGCNLEYEQEFVRVLQDEYNTAVKMFLVGESMKLNFVVNETALSQIVNMLAAATYTAGAIPGTNPNTLTVGGGTMREMSVGLEGIASTGQELVVYVNKVVAISKIGVPFKKRGVRLVQCELEAMCDTAATDGARLATIYEVTKAA